MTMYLDCEFDAFGGPLISMAIATPHGDDFYEVLTDQASDPWVKENVLPLLKKKPIEEVLFRERLAEYLLRHADETIIADFPCDFKYLMQMIAMPGGKCVRVNLNMQLYLGLETRPEVSHYAPSDAIALMRAHKLAISRPTPAPTSSQMGALSPTLYVGGNES